MKTSGCFVMFTTLDLASVLEHSVAIAKEAGHLLRHYANRPNHVDHKSSDADLVTEIDRQSEALIVGRLRELFPDHHIIGEEGGSYNIGESPNYQWYVDPIDGTTNFAHGIPHFCVSMALTDSNRMPLIGVIYDPMRDECYSAIHKQGARLNGVPIRVSSTPKLSAAVVASGFPYDKWTSSQNNAAEWSNFVERVRGVRRMGSAALDLAYVAAGRFDGYWEQKLNLWDVAAGVLFVWEAGGKVTNYEGSANEVMIARPRLVASNGLIHDSMVKVLQLGHEAPRPADGA